MTETKEGGCHCGNVRLSVTGAPKKLVQCHCNDCQKLSGGAPAYLAIFADDQVSLNRGSPRCYTVTGASGKPVHRHFCGDCGTPLYSKPEAFAGFTMMKIGALGGLSDFTPAYAVWTASAPPWHKLPDGVECYAKGSGG